VEVKSGAKTINFSEVPSFNLDDYRVVEKVSRGLWHRTVISSGPMPVIKVDVFHPPLSDSSLHSAAPSGQVSIAEERSPPRRRSCSPRRLRRSSTSSHQKEDEGGSGSRPGPSTDRDTSNQPNEHGARDSEEGLDHAEGTPPVHERINEKDSNNLVRPNASVDSRSSLAYDPTSSGWSTDTRRSARPTDTRRRGRRDYQWSEASQGSIERHMNLYLQLSDIKGDLWVEIITIVTILGFLYLQLLGIFFGGAFAGRIVGPKAGAWTVVSTVVSASVGTVQFSFSIGVHIVSVGTLLMTSISMTQQTQQQTNRQAQHDQIVAAIARANLRSRAMSGVAVRGTFGG
jgi:hypothetical protein